LSDRSPDVPRTREVVGASADVEDPVKVVEQLRADSPGSERKYGWLGTGRRRKLPYRVRDEAQVSVAQAVKLRQERLMALRLERWGVGDDTLVGLGLM
jgi:hypothetical protein